MYKSFLINKSKKIYFFKLILVSHILIDLLVFHANIISVDSTLLGTYSHHHLQSSPIGTEPREHYKTEHLEAAVLREPML